MSNSDGTLRGNLTTLLNIFKNLSPLTSNDPRFLALVKDLLNLWKELHQLVVDSYPTLEEDSARIKAIITDFLTSKKNNHTGFDYLSLMSPIIKRMTAKEQQVASAPATPPLQHPLAGSGSQARITGQSAVLLKKQTILISKAKSLVTQLRQLLDQPSQSEVLGSILSHVQLLARQIDPLSFPLDDANCYRVETLRATLVGMTEMAERLVARPGDTSTKLRLIVASQTTQTLIDGLSEVDPHASIAKFKKNYDAIPQNDQALKATKEVVSGFLEEFYPTIPTNGHVVRGRSTSSDVTEVGFSGDGVIAPTKSSFTIEPEIECLELPPSVLNIVGDVYATKFHDNEHSLFLATHTKKNEMSIFAVLSNAKTEGEFEAIHITKRGYTCLVVPDKGPDRGRNLRIIKYLTTEYPDLALLHIKEHDIYKPLVKAIEVTSPQTRNEVTVSVVLCLKGQKNPHEMFANAATPEFNSFLDTMGIDKLDKVANRAKPWGHMNVKYFVASQLNSDEHRRDVGNAPAFIFFKEEGEQFDSSEIDKLGMVPQLFAVVQPRGKEKYRVGFFFSGNMQRFSPLLPARFLFDRSNLQNFLLTKIHNGYIQFFSTAPMNAGFMRARADSLEVFEKLKAVPKPLN